MACLNIGAPFIGTLLVPFCLCRMGQCSMTSKDEAETSWSQESQLAEGPVCLLPGSQVYLDVGKLNLLFNASKALASTTDLDQLLSIIVGEVRRVLACDAAAVVLYDEERDEFFWKIIQEKENLLASAREQIRIPRGQGVVTGVFETGQPAIIHDAANDPRVYKPVDQRSGFGTRNLMCVPLKAREKSLGVIYAINKEKGTFTEDDVEILVALSSNIALALENASQYEKLMTSYKELERLHRVKTKILHHLSHELKTPLAIIEASLKIMERRIEAQGPAPGKLPFERILRNLGRLKLIERQVGYIVDEKEYANRKIISDFLDHLKDLIELQEEDEPQLAEALEAIKGKVEELFREKAEETALVAVAAAFQAAEYQVRREARDRALDITFLTPDPALIKVQPSIMMSVLVGLIRNAVENTPNHGKIVVKGQNTDAGYEVSIVDCGVGIPESEQPNIFEGFYPVQATDLYSSGRRYGFNAGGTGTDLLKMKIFSERCGFKLRFQSRRCSCIPTVRDICPGDITRCACCESMDDCYANGGTEFIVEFPPHLVQISREAVA